MITRLRFLAAGMIAVCMMAGRAEAGVLNGAADLVLGQSSFVVGSTQPASGASVNRPNSIAIDKVNGRLYVADTFNNRVLWWDNVAALSSGQAASGVLGQPNPTDTAPNQGLGESNPTAGTLHYPSSVSVDASGRLWVVDAGNNRVLRFDSPATKSTADFVLGQAAMTTAWSGTARDKFNWPLGVAVDAAGNVWVADNGNNRVLGFSAANIGAKSADYVIGQADFVTRVMAPPASASSLNEPQGVFVDSQGNLWIGDDSNSRFLRFSPPFTATGMNANLVLGQESLAPNLQHSENRGSFANAGTIHCAFAITDDGAGNYWAADFSNNRVLRYSGTLSNGMNASQVIGQADFYSVAPNRGGAPGANTLYHPNSVAVDASGDLWVCEGASFSVCHEGGNSRIVKYNMIKVLSIDPGLADNARPWNVTVNGMGIASGTTARLARMGQKDIVGTNASFVSDESRMQVTFDLTGAAAGTWDLVLENGGLSVTLPNAITVLAVKVTSITPARAVNDAPVDVVISGENFFSGIIPKLQQQGRADIEGQAVVVVSSSQVNCRFDILDAATGFWNVSVAPTAEGTKANAFDVHFPSAVARTILRTRAYHLGMETDSGIFTFDIPQSAFSDTLFLAAGLPQRPVPPVSEPEFRASDVAIEVTNDRNLQPVRELGIGFYYKDGLVGSLDRTKLAACFCDEPTGRWIPVNSRCERGGGCVQARTRHLCIYRLVQLVPAGSLSGIKVYPNPYTPGTGDRYDDPLLGQGIAFSGLTAQSKIKIFTVTGELVLQHDETDGTGIFVWDTKNDRGEKAASGVYLYLIDAGDNGSEKKKGKFSIVR